MSRRDYCKVAKDFHLDLVVQALEFGQAEETTAYSAVLLPGEHVRQMVGL